MTYAIGGLRPQSTETKALKSIDSGSKPFVNKDFVKNIAYLNNTTDYMSSFMQTMQGGIDDANRNPIEQIQDFIADIIVLFAGLDPTNFEFGDLKYTIQGIGALLGFSPDTPFPLNLLEAAEHFLSNYIIPLPQFTDVIFEAILAWGEAFGLSPAFIQSMRDLLDAFEGLYDAFHDLLGAASGLFDIFGITIGDDSSFGVFGDLWTTILDVLQPIIDVGGDIIGFISEGLAPIIEFIATIVNTLNPSSWISGGQIRTEGSEIAPPAANSTTSWAIGSNANTTWIWDTTQSSDSAAGSFTTNGNSTAKRMLSQAFFDCAQDDKFNISAMLRWSGIPAASNGFGLCIVWYLGGTETSQSNITVANGHGATGGWELRSGQVTTPANADRFRIGFYVTNGISSGQVWGDVPSAKKLGDIPQSMIGGLLDVLEGLLPWNFFDTILGGSTTEGGLLGFFSGLLGPNSPLAAFNIFGILNPGNIGSISLSSIFNPSDGVGPNLLVEPEFTSTDSISLGSGWIRDATTGRTNPGSARATANGYVKTLQSLSVPVVEGEKLRISTWCSWNNLTYTSTNPVSITVSYYNGTTFVSGAVVSSQTSPALNQPTFIEFTGSDVTVPAGVTFAKVVFKVAATANSGNVWFDDASLKKIGSGLPQSWITNLIPDLGGIRDFAQGLLDTLIGIIRGIPLVGGTLADLLEQFTGQTQVIANNSATTNQILAAFGPGNPDADDFERVNTVNLGAKWTIYQTGVGTIAIPNGHDASFISPYSNTAEYLAISDILALTDNMQGSVVLSTVPDTAFPLFSSPVYAQDDIWLRVPNTVTSWATRTGLRCRVSSEKVVSLSWFLNGTETVLLAPTAFPALLASGASFTYEVGAGGMARRHVAKIGATPIMDFTEAGTVSQIGGKRRAFGGKNVGSNTQANSSAYKQWTAQG